MFPAVKHVEGQENLIHFTDYTLELWFMILVITIQINVPYFPFYITAFKYSGCFNDNAVFDYTCAVMFLDSI